MLEKGELKSYEAPQVGNFLVKLNHNEVTTYLEVYDFGSESTFENFRRNVNHALHLAMAKLRVPSTYLHLLQCNNSDFYEARIPLSLLLKGQGDKE